MLTSPERAPADRAPEKRCATTGPSAVWFSCAFGRGKPQVRRVTGRGAAW
ncbi:hypothetical protein SLI_7156 [Streptomyces lividans 1326]|uniref:Uncharacterized protein n=1 Tax=Streptomyces lividans 1326 TaxID=1200984 RepID=A0A7U9E0M0_STRLI|nr:hypothetical protein SLI_7156 [Streptomyces lividans 1326]